MKSRKVLLGLIVGLCVCLAGTATAQKANFQSNKLVEIGPDNIGGRVTSVVIVNNATDEASSLVYAGAASGGLYVRNLRSDDLWKYQPCYVDGKELTLPISRMVRINDSIILIATGESYYPKGCNLNKMAAHGRGLFLFNLKDNNAATRFTRVNNTDPGYDFDANFASVNEMATMSAMGVTYVYVATPKGLFRWTINQPSDWNKAPQSIFSGNVHSVVVSKQFNRAFFSCEGGLYKISDVINSADPVNITGSCEGFGGNAKTIKLALAPSDESYLYALSSDRNGLMIGLYLSRNTNSWQILSTSTVIPFNGSATANTCGAVAVSPTDPSRVYIAGANVWVGKGYVDNSPYQWTVTSSNENQLNFGDYMSTVYSNSQFVHSGIQQIVCNAYWNEATSSIEDINLVATDGGIYSFTSSSPRFVNYNRGLNNVQINGLAVTPDGSIIAGSNSNGCPFIESRMEHHGGANDSTWYDGSRGNTNHMANILWKGNGGKVAASRFTQYQPESRRPIFVSSGNGSLGRAYKDFSNYTNTQVWTSDEAFTSDQISGGPTIGQISLWETDNNPAKDSIRFTIDTLGTVRRGGKDVKIGNSGFQIKTGDSIVVLDTAHAFHPFYHVFDHSFFVRNEPSHTVRRPYASRMLAVTVEKDMTENSNVSYCWVPTDFRKVYDASNETRFWGHIYGINRTNIPHNYIRYAVMSQDGDCVFIAVDNDTLNQSYIVRVHGFNSLDYSLPISVVRGAIKYDFSRRSTTTDTIRFADGTYHFGRRISSINIDPRAGQDRLVVTFDGYSTEYPNVVYIDNASSNNYQIHEIGLPGANANVPAYSAMVEFTKGEVYVGTEDGVFKAPSLSASPSWSEYGDFRGVPVTSMYQVTCDYPMFKHIGHKGVSEELYIFPRTKWSKAMYFGTYGRGIFMDSTYVVNHENEIVSEDIYLDIPTVYSVSNNSVRFYPNPAVNHTTMELTVGTPGKATAIVYDLSGKVVYSENLGNLAEGVHTRTIDCQNLQHGMYLVNVVIGGQKATSKLVVR